MKTRLSKMLQVSAVITLFFACNSNKDLNVLKQELNNVEKEFETADKNKGIPEVFSYYADEEAVMLRENDTLSR
jgi:hypothetical protein